MVASVCAAPSLRACRRRHAAQGEHHDAAWPGPVNTAADGTAGVRQTAAGSGAGGGGNLVPAGQQEAAHGDDHGISNDASARLA
ncbi:hypothetical protein OG777_12990 [Micromonospora peucetia]|uniref:hypothetical protein n=1 Tax=Micromonospora peucetia TaxID=47871 RepID=UPI002254012D|nr:hypothetical protein [Micromonospora peucetia]MCX4387843.1 hypothetical protein [Micromonospora peucetia]